MRSSCSRNLIIHRKECECGPNNWKNQKARDYRLNSALNSTLTLLLWPRPRHSPRQLPFLSLSSVQTRRNEPHDRNLNEWPTIIKNQSTQLKVKVNSKNIKNWLVSGIKRQENENKSDSLNVTRPITCYFDSFHEKLHVAGAVKPYRNEKGHESWSRLRLRRRKLLAASVVVVARIR